MTSSSRAVLDQLDPRVPPAMITLIENRSEPPVPARAASSVVLLRDHDGLQTYVLHRQSTMRFAAGKVVFPGGGVDACDGGDDDQPTLRRCAIRETEEETGVRLLTTDLRHWAHWITPEFEPRRYDTHFYLAAQPADQQARDISGEAWLAEWRSPDDLLRAADAGEEALMPPTRSILIELTEHDSAAAVLAAAEDRLVRPVLPRPVQQADGWVFRYAEGSDT